MHLTTIEGQQAHYASVRARLVGASEMQRRIEAAREKGARIAAQLEQEAREAAEKAALEAEWQRKVNEADAPAREIRAILKGNAHGRVKKIQAEVAAAAGIRIADIMSAQRFAQIALPRHFAQWRACMETPLSLPEIGRRFGGRDHTSIMHAKRRIQKMIDAGAIPQFLLDTIPQEPGPENAPIAPACIGSENTYEG